MKEKLLDYSINALIATVIFIALNSWDKTRTPEEKALTLDLIEIMQLKTESVLKEGGNAEDEFEALLQTLMPTIERISKEQGKPIYVKQAVIAGPTIDLTPAILEEIKKAGFLP